MESQILLEELGPSGPGLRPRRLILPPVAGPLAGSAPWATEQRVAPSWSSRQGEASHQVLGSKLPPATWSGEWRTNLLYRAPALFTDERGEQRQIVSPGALDLVFESLTRGGQEIRVAWVVEGQIGTTNTTRDVIRKTRVGRITNYTVTPNTADVMTWSVTWEWLGLGTTPQVAVDKGASFDAEAGDLLREIKGLEDLNPAKALDFHKTLSDVEKIATAPSSIVNDVQNQVQDITSGIREVAMVANRAARTTSQSANSMLGFAKEMGATVRRACEDIGRIPAELMSRDDEPAAVIRANAAMGANVQALHRVDAAALTLEEASRQKLPSSKGGATPALRVHVAKEGDTPGNVSIKYFRTGDRAADILRANRMPLHRATFEPGEKLLIPSQALEVET